LKDEGIANNSSYAVIAEKDVKFPDRYCRIKLHMMNLHIKRNLGILLYVFIEVTCSVVCQHYRMYMYEELSESAQTVVVTAWVKEDERRGEVRPRSHFCKPVASVCHVTLHFGYTLFSHQCFFYFLF
jgi:hypothetical protein